MGQTPSAASKPPPASSPSDLTLLLTDDCLSLVFLCLPPSDRLTCSLVCRRWLSVEGLTRQRLALDARAALLSAAPSLLSRFSSLTKLALRCDRRSDSIGDDALLLISLRCPLLSRLKLRSCRRLTPSGMASLASNSPNLKKLSCSSCSFGSQGVSAVLLGCPNLEELSLKRLRGLADSSPSPTPLPHGHIRLRSVTLKDLYNGQSLSPLLASCPRLLTLRISCCNGEWDAVLVEVTAKAHHLKELHLEKLQVTDMGLQAVTSCPDLDVLRLLKTPECTDTGLSAIAESCRLLRKLHVDGWRTDRIGDAGLSAVARSCRGLQELVLIGMNPTLLSLAPIVENCRGLERLAVCSSETFGDAELACVAGKCTALRKLCIWCCPVSDVGMEALAGGCPSLVKVKVKKCRNVTAECAEWLRASRGMQVVNLNMELPELVDASEGLQVVNLNVELPELVDASESGAMREQFRDMEEQTVAEEEEDGAGDNSNVTLGVNGNGLCFFVASAFRKLSVASSSQ